MNRLKYSAFAERDIQQLKLIDRSEYVEGVYRNVAHRLILEYVREAVPPWSPHELLQYTSRVQSLLAAGGHAYGAWSETSLVGFASLDVRGVDDDPRTLRLDMLYVSAPYRYRGIGKTLISLVADQARALGATRLYISATPTFATVTAYLKAGAELLEHPDPSLYAEEPEDIHLVLRLI